MMRMRRFVSGILLALPAHARGRLKIFFDSAGVRVHYTAEGKGEPVVLIHGWGADLKWIGALKVVSRTSVMRYKNTVRHLTLIARELGVDAVVEGTVLLPGGRVRISVQLIRAATDEHLWADTIRRSNMSWPSRQTWRVLSLMKSRPSSRQRSASASKAAAASIPLRTN